MEAQASVLRTVRKWAARYAAEGVAGGTGTIVCYIAVSAETRTSVAELVQLSPNRPNRRRCQRRDAAPFVLPDFLRKAAAARAMLSYTERAPWPPACIRPTAMTATTMASIFSVDHSLSGFSLPAGSLRTLTFDVHQVAIGLPPCCSSRPIKRRRNSAEAGPMLRKPWPNSTRDSPSSWRLRTIAAKVRLASELRDHEARGKRNLRLDESKSVASPSVAIRQTLIAPDRVGRAVGPRSPNVHVPVRRGTRSAGRVPGTQQDFRRSLLLSGSRSDALKRAELDHLCTHTLKRPR